MERRRLTGRSALGEALNLPAFRRFVNAAFGLPRRDFGRGRRVACFYQAANEISLERLAGKRLL